MRIQRVRTLASGLAAASFVLVGGTLVAGAQTSRDFGKADSLQGAKNPEGAGVKKAETADQRCVNGSEAGSA